LTFFWGTFLTRSGLLDNVSLHSFADMDKSAKGILCWSMVGLLTAFAVIYGLLVKKATADMPKPADEPQGLNREAFYRFGMVVVGMFAVVVTLGMSWPVIVATIQHSTGSKVEEWLYHQVTVWFFIPIMLLMAITPFVSWKGEGFRTLWARLFSVVCISIGLTGFAQMGLMSPQIGVRPAAAASVAGPFHTSAPLVYWMLLLLFLCIFVLVANMWRLGEILKRSPLGVGGFIAHAGMAVLMGGLILSRGYEQKQTVFVRKGAPAFALDGYLITYKDATKLDPFDRDGKVFFTVHPPTGADYEISPGLYKYGDPDDPKEMVWPYIQRTPTHDMYFSMNPPVFTAWEKPVLIKPGESSSIDGAQVEYLSPTMKGKPGTMGVTFGAKLRVTVEDELGEVHQYIANPSVQLTENGLAASLAPVGKDYLIAMIGGMDASDRGVQLMLFFNPPIFPITVYYKPLTYLVWLGPAIMAFGALLAGWSRRPPSARKAPVPVVASGRPAKGRVTAPGGEPA
jgi:cytochrome c-type biogenesis protein CcmF